MQVKKEKNSDNRGNSTKKGIRFEDELFEKIIEQAQNCNESFAGWVKEACKQRLKRDKAIKKP